MKTLGFRGIEALLIDKSELDEETGKTSSSFLMYSTVQFTPENIAAIKGVSGVKYCSARQDNLLPFDGLSLFPGTVSTDAKYRGYTKTLGICNTEDDELFTTSTLTLAEGRHISVNDTNSWRIYRGPPASKLHEFTTFLPEASILSS